MPVDFSADHGDWQLSVVVTDPPWYENCYIVRHVPTGKLVVVDPGGSADKILAALAEIGGEVECILLTHGHPDHLGAVKRLQDELAVPCKAHRDEGPLIDVIVNYAKSRLGMTIEPPNAVDYFTDDDRLTLGGQAFRAIPTPGHTPGGVCFDFGGFTLAGDTLFNQGVGRTDLPGGNGPLLVKSISNLLAALPDASFIYSGHGPRWTAGEAKPWWKAMQAYSL
ncbi:MAG TPA: MBL fold metallo-hydrolase [Candidatus Sulfotelmatobacter sp.]|jgi:glyoxylase-like metal-dependent hydrolase (beta-lactamase superfamily II)|nr:MBL fold metallo-hydrolase [Candidatus Sulfotelmatobacter sp.]